jgi:hypothetical protein
VYTFGQQLRIYNCIQRNKGPIAKCSLVLSYQQLYLTKYSIYYYNILYLYSSLLEVTTISLLDDVEVGLSIFGNDLHFLRKKFIHGRTGQPVLIPPICLYGVRLNSSPQILGNNRSEIKTLHIKMYIII